MTSSREANIPTRIYFIPKPLGCVACSLGWNNSTRRLYKDKEGKLQPSSQFPGRGRECDCGISDRNEGWLFSKEHGYEVATVPRMAHSGLSWKSRSIPFDAVNSSYNSNTQSCNTWVAPGTQNACDLYLIKTRDRQFSSVVQSEDLQGQNFS